MNLSERQAKIESIRQFPAAFEAALKPLLPDHLDAHCGGPEEWTVRQVVHHVADAHVNGFIRMKLVASENLPILKPYDQDAWATHADTQLPLDSSLEILRGLHARWAVFLAGLPEENWTRSGVHLENGLVSLDNLLSIYVNHGEGHIEQVKKAA